MRITYVNDEDDENVATLGPWNVNTTNDGDQNYEQDNERDEDQNDESEDVEFSVTVRPLSENDSIGATWSLFAGFWGVNEESPPIPPVVWDPDNPASRVDQVPEEQVSDAATTLPSSDQKEEEAENDDTDKETGVERESQQQHEMDADTL